MQSGDPATRLSDRLLPASPELADRLASIVEVGARLGYTARAAVYISVGLFALLAASRLAPHAVGVIGALQAWGDWPLGIVLLWIAGGGLYAFAGWRALQAFLDVDRLGATPAALGARAGKAISGVVYGGLGVSVFGLLDAMEDLREVDDQAATQEAVRNALATPWGGPLVIAFGTVIAVAGAANMVRAVVSHFTGSLACEEGVAWCAGSLARVGYFARGVAMALAGYLTAVAGWHARASEARGVGGALEMLRTQPFGHGLLGLIGLGLMAFGAFGLMKAGLRRIGV
jgi:hypothetical protein